MQTADGKDWPILFSRVNSGLGHATTGMAIHLTQLHLITTTASAGKRRKREKVLDQDASNMVYLGASGRPYAKAEDTTVARDIIGGLLELAAEFPAWPQNVHEVLPFAERVKCFAQSARSHKVVDKEGSSWGLLGGRDEVHQYTVLHFCRAMLYVVEGCWGPAIWDTTSMSELCKYCPDECDLVNPVMSWTGRDVRRAFDVSPLLLSCFACLVDDIPEDERPRAMTTPLDILWKILREYERDLEKQVCEGIPEWELCQPLFAPGPRILAQEAAARQKRSD